LVHVRVRAEHDRLIVEDLNAYGRPWRAESFPSSQTSEAADLATRWDEESADRTQRISEGRRVHESLQQMVRQAKEYGITAKRASVTDDAAAAKRQTVDEFKAEIALWRELLGHYTKDDLQAFREALGGQAQALRMPAPEAVKEFMASTGVSSSRRGMRTYTAPPDRTGEMLLVVGAADEVARATAEFNGKTARPDWSFRDGPDQLSRSERRGVEFTHHGQTFRFAATADGATSARVALDELISAAAVPRFEAQAGSRAINDVLGRRADERAQSV
jgi:hypothetical protein